MDLEAVETTIETWVGDLTGLTVHWKTNVPRAIPFPHVELQLLTIAGKGHDYPVQTYNIGTDDTTVTMTGIRTMTIQINFRSRDQNLGESARQYAELFRTRLDRPSSIDYLVAANIANTNTLSVVEADYHDRSGNRVSQVAVDMLFELRSTEVDPTWGGEFIQTVNIEATEYVVDEEGVPVVDLDGTIVIVDV